MTTTLNVSTSVIEQAKLRHFVVVGICYGMYGKQLINLLHGHVLTINAELQINTERSLSNAHPVE